MAHNVICINSIRKTITCIIHKLCNTSTKVFTCGVQGDELPNEFSLYPIFAGGTILLLLRQFLCRKLHDDVIKWKHFLRNWPFVRGNHRSPVNSPHKGQWRGALMSSLICVWINDWVHNREADDLRRYRAHYDVIYITMTSSNFRYKLNRRSVTMDTPSTNS